MKSGRIEFVLVVSLSVMSCIGCGGGSPAATSATEPAIHTSTIPATPMPASTSTPTASSPVAADASYFATVKDAYGGLDSADSAMARECNLDNNYSNCKGNAVAVYTGTVIFEERLRPLPAPSCVAELDAKLRVGLKDYEVRAQQAMNTPDTVVDPEGAIEIDLGTDEVDAPAKAIVATSHC